MGLKSAEAASLCENNSSRAQLQIEVHVLHGYGRSVSYKLYPSVDGVLQSKQFHHFFFTVMIY